eukprot:14729356-Ditylum_brightwellii.AAC.1
MNKYKVKCEGELVTGCIKKFHRLDKRRQHDLCEAIRRQFRELRNTTRKTFFCKVHEHCNGNVGRYTSDVSLHEENDDVDDELISIIEEQVCGGSSDLHCTEGIFARKLAAACYEATYNHHIRSGDQHSKIYGCILYGRKDTMYCHDKLLFAGTSRLSLLDG